MKDIIVTTPKSHRESAALEAEQCKACILDGGEAWYFRWLGLKAPKHLQVGSRVYYVEEGYIRGFALVSVITWDPGMVCHTTGRHFRPGVYACMDARTWCWIAPIKMKGFQGFRYARFDPEEVEVIGHWLDPRPGT